MAVHSVQFFRLVHGTVLVGTHLRSLCGYGHSLVVGMNLGPFLMAYLEELVLGSRRILDICV